MLNLLSHIWHSPRGSPIFLNVSIKYFGVNFHLSVTKAMALSIYLLLFIYLFIYFFEVIELPRAPKPERNRQRHLITFISETRKCYELVHWVIIRYIHTISQKHTSYLCQGSTWPVPKIYSLWETCSLQNIAHTVHLQPLYQYSW